MSHEVKHMPRSESAIVSGTQSCTHGSLVLAARLKSWDPHFINIPGTLRAKLHYVNSYLSTGTRTEQYRAPSEMPVQLYKIRAQNINGIRQNPGSSWL